MNEVITEKMYNEIKNKWPNGSPIYHNYGTLVHRYSLIKDYIHLLKNCDVLEIGANSGLFMYSLMQHASTLIELEPHDEYSQQCLITLDCLSDYHNGKVSVLKNTLEEFSKTNYEFNALYASFVLYHLNDNEIKILQEQILPKCEVVIIPNRNKERGKKKNSYNLNRPQEIAKLLQTNGFKTKIDLLNNTGYSVIVGTR